MGDFKFRGSSRDSTRDYYYRERQGSCRGLKEENVGHAPRQIPFPMQDSKGHDDRSDERSVKFKGNRRRGRWRGEGRKARKNLKAADQAFSGSEQHTPYDPEGDVVMAGGGDAEARKNRFVPYERRGQRRFRARPGRRDHGDGYPATSGQRDGWFKVVIPFGKKHEKNFILKSLTDNTDVPFVPYYFHYEGEAAIFYVENRDISRAIQRMTNRITTPNGFKLKIVTSPSSPPQIPMDDSVLEKIKACMGKRFSAITNSLDLTSFYLDQDLKSQGIYASLDRVNVMSKVIAIIEENIPDLQILNLSSNKISSLDAFKVVSNRVKTVRILHLTKNNLRNVSELDHIKDFPLEELVLDGNPLCDHYNDQASYVSAIRQRFPKITKLDGHDLPPQYGFGLEKIAVLPPSQGTFFVNDKTREMVPKFLEQYFNIYDFDDRQKLLNAYHDQAVFSFMIMQPKSGLGPHSSSLNNNITDSRNLLKLNNFARRMKLLHQGKLSVVSFLCQLPKTQHDPASFSVDVTQTFNKFMTVTCSGVFKEGESRQSNSGHSNPIRAFSRVFLIVPYGEGFCIVNEMLCISNATLDQIKVAFKVPAPTPSPSPVPPAIAASPNSEQQEHMVLSFSGQSGMNIAWSRQCLEQNEWDFEKAAYVFQELHKSNQIPTEAFDRH